jgi:N-acetylmuramoyl-L-alanine amidase
LHRFITRRIFLIKFYNPLKKRQSINISIISSTAYLLLLVFSSTSLKAQEGTRATSGPEIITEPLFGANFEQVEITDQRLKGAIFYLVSGHGGPDPGAMGKVGKNMLCEDEYAYDITLRFGRELLRHEAKVYFMVRDPHDGIRNELYLRSSKDEVCYPNLEIPLNQFQRLKQRVDAINTLYRNEKLVNYKRCIELHVDARDTKKNIDIFFYYHPGSKNGERLATTIWNSIERKYQIKQPGRGYSGNVSTRNLFMLERTVPTALFIELGNINHTRDQQRLIYENNRQALANWMCEGVMADFQNSK